MIQVRLRTSGHTMPVESVVVDEVVGETTEN